MEQAEGHDDFLISLALCAHAMEGLVQSAAAERSGGDGCMRGRGGINGACFCLQAIRPMIILFFEIFTSPINVNISLDR